MPDPLQSRIRGGTPPRSRASARARCGIIARRRRKPREPATPTSASAAPVFWIDRISSSSSPAHYGWCGSWIASLTYEETDDAFVAGHVHQISSRISGSVKEVLVTDNQLVKAHDVLARMEPLENEINVQKAQAAISRARRR